MRLTSLAAGIFTLALAGYVGVTTEAPAKSAPHIAGGPQARSNQRASNRISRIAARSGQPLKITDQRRQRVRHGAQQAARNRQRPEQG